VTRKFRIPNKTGCGQLRTATIHAVLNCCRGFVGVF
jgi:hypothetical protein